jgi:hypothetical protein
MLIPLLLAAAHATADTTVVLARTERDLTGDGIAEVLTVTAVGPTVDSLPSVTFTVVAGADTIYRYRLAPLTRTVGFDGDKQRISAEENRVRLAEYEAWFFGQSKFQSAAAFIEHLRSFSREHVDQIPASIARSAAAGDSMDTRELWREMQAAPITIFEFSPGGDEVVAIGWSQRAKRFYRLFYCC